VISVVIGIPFLDRQDPNPNQPLGWATGTPDGACLPGCSRRPTGAVSSAVSP